MRTTLKNPALDLRPSAARHSLQLRRDHFFNPTSYSIGDLGISHAAKGLAATIASDPLPECARLISMYLNVHLVTTEFTWLMLSRRTRSATAPSRRIFSIRYSAGESYEHHGSS